MVCKTHQRSADSIAKEFQTSTGININTSFMEWVSMAEQLHASLTSTMQSVVYSGVKHIATGIWSSGNVLCGVTNHASLFGSLIGESGEMFVGGGIVVHYILYTLKHAGLNTTQCWLNIGQNTCWVVFNQQLG